MGLTLPLRALDAYLGQVPDDATVRRLRARFALRSMVFRDAAVHRHPGVSSLGGRSPELAHRAIDLTDEALTDASGVLGVPRPASLSLFLYPSRRVLEQVNCLSEWAGAFYDGAVHLDEPVDNPASTAWTDSWRSERRASSASSKRHLDAGDDPGELLSALHIPLDGPTLLAFAEAELNRLDE